RILLAWKGPIVPVPDLTYHLFRDGAMIWSGAALNYTDLSVTKGVTYSYSVAAQNTVGRGPNSTIVMASPVGEPDPPWGLIAAAGNTRATLNWNAGNYSGPGMLTYHLFRDGAEVYNGPQTSYTDIGLDNGRSYNYQVAASNSVGWSANSTAVRVTPQGPPSAPTGLEAEGDIGYVALRWSAPSYAGPGALIYHLFRDGAPIWSGAMTSYVDDDVVVDVAYSYTVAARNLIGWGPNSSSATAIPIAYASVPPEAPTGLVASPGDGLVRLAWEAPMESGTSVITGYRVYRLVMPGSYELIATVTGLTFTDSGLTNGREYSYKVCAISSVGESDPTGDISAIPDFHGPGGRELTSNIEALTIVVGGLFVVFIGSLSYSFWVRYRRP
ncbi:MAG TPA: fibronectin type III domain-containing protein, partial [Methanomassiliicoccales archaeon]|nr:fibronectin type III domain-containing protein [Methanomassiliicoccales archaeon]